MMAKPEEEHSIAEKPTKSSDSTSSEESFHYDATKALLERTETLDPSTENQPSTSSGITRKTEKGLPFALPKHSSEMETIQTVGEEPVVRFIKGAVTTPDPETEVVHAERRINPTKYDLPGIPIPEQANVLYAYAYANPANRSNKFSLKWWDYIFAVFAESYMVVMFLFIIVGVITAIIKAYFLN